MKVYGLYNQDKEVVNVILYDPSKRYLPPEGLTLLNNPNCQIGDRLNEQNVLERETSPNNWVAVSGIINN